MKTMILIIVCFLSLKSYSCDKDSYSVCPGELVVVPDNTSRSGEKYKLSGRVLAISQDGTKVTVGDTYPEARESRIIKMEIEDIQNIYITKNCIDGICVHDETYVAGTFNGLAAIVGINPYTRMVAIRGWITSSTMRGYLMTVYLPAKEVQITNFCVEYDKHHPIRVESFKMPL